MGEYAVGGHDGGMMTLGGASGGAKVFMDAPVGVVRRWVICGGSKR